MVATHRTQEGGTKFQLLLPPAYSHMVLLGYYIPCSVPNVFLLPKNIKVLEFEGAFWFYFFYLWVFVLVWLLVGF